MRKKDELAKDHTCMSHAHPEEMVFVLLSRDVAAPVAIRAWVAERLRVGKNVDTDPQIVEALECARTMEIEGAKWKPKPPVVRPYMIAFLRASGVLNGLTFLVDLESQETGDRSRAMHFASMADVEKMLRAYEWIAARGGMIMLDGAP